MNQRIAALHLARRYPCFDALANLMGKRPDTLRKELAGVEGYKWGVDDQELLIQLCQAAKVTDALAPITAAAANAGALLLLLPAASEDHAPTFKCLADAAQEFGVFMTEVGAAIADGRVTANELKRVEQDFCNLVAKGQACLQNLKALHEGGKPTVLRDVKAA